MQNRSKIGFVLIWFVLVITDMGLMWIFGLLKDMNFIWVASILIGTAIFVYFIYRVIKKSAKN